ncbi:MAG: hypothetical protein WC460_06900 [Patescibacteria group bacterium]
MNRLDQIKKGIEAKLHTGKTANIMHGIRCNVRAAIDKPVKGKGSIILTNLVQFLTVSGRSWGDPKTMTMDSIAGEFLARLRDYLQTVAVRYESDQKLFILIDKKWFELTRTDFTVNLLPMLREIGAPSGYLNATLIKKLYPMIVELWKSIDPEYKQVSKLLE